MNVFCFPACTSFTDNCVVGIKPNKDKVRSRPLRLFSRLSHLVLIVLLSFKIAQHVANSLMLVTALNRVSWLSPPQQVHALPLLMQHNKTNFLPTI